MRSLVLPLLEPWQLEELQKKKSVDLSFMRENLGRFRVNIHYQRGDPRRQHPPAAFADSVAGIAAPAAPLAKLAERRQGLVLVTGPTGCGKTSTLAALIDIVNTRRAGARGDHRRSRSSTSMRTAARSSSRSKWAATRRISP